MFCSKKWAIAVVGLEPTQHGVKVRWLYQFVHTAMQKGVATLKLIKIRNLLPQLLEKPLHRFIYKNFSDFCVTNATKSSKETGRSRTYKTVSWAAADKFFWAYQFALFLKQYLVVWLQFIQHWQNWTATSQSSAKRSALETRRAGSCVSFITNFYWEKRICNRHGVKIWD